MYKFPAINLLDHGPTLEGEVYRDSYCFLKAKNDHTASSFAPVKLLVDTGSNISGLDASIIGELGLTPYRGSAAVNGVGGIHRIRRFSCILFAGIFGRKGLPLDVVEGDFSQSSYHGVIGRDVLQYCKMVYDGPLNAFTIEAIDF